MLKLSQNFINFISTFKFGCYIYIFSSDVTLVEHKIIFPNIRPFNNVCYNSPSLIHINPIPTLIICQLTNFFIINFQTIIDLIIHIMVFIVKNRFRINFFFFFKPMVHTSDELFI